MDLISSGFTLRDVGDRISWDTLREYLYNASPNSATARKMNPDLSMWASSLKTNALLADIFDVLAMINANICSLGSGQPAKRPPRIEHPGDKNRQKIGGKRMTMKEFDAHMAKKRADYQKRKG